MATLRYIAYLANDPEKLVEFYRRFLGTEELGRSPEGDISITDGFYNLTFFKKRPALGEMHTETGLHHIGLQVDDLEAQALSARHDHSGAQRSAAWRDSLP